MSKRVEMSQKTGAQMSKNVVANIVIFGVMALLLVLSAQEFSQSYELETIVEGPGVTGTGLLSDYFSGLEGTPGDTEIYYLDSGEPGGTIFILGGTHPNEPAGVLAAIMWIENAVLDEGRVIVIPRANASALTFTEPLQGSPPFFSIETEWGERRFRYGSRLSSPLHQFPDPEVYVHTSGQLLSGSEVRNLNRVFPGRPDGLLTEQIAYGIMNVVWDEDVDFVLDLHESRPINPIVNSIIAHPNTMDVAAMAAMTLGAFEGVPIRLEPSPERLRGITHREIGDHSEAKAVILESPNPAMDALRGRTDEDLIVIGQDDFFLKASEHDLIRVPYIDGVGFPIAHRVGRHMSSTAVLIELFTEFNPDKPVMFSNVPRNQDILDNGLGHYLLRP